MYKLTKVFIHEGKDSLVQVGQSILGDLYVITEYATPNLEVLPEEITIGSGILVQRGLKDFIGTSAVKRVAQNTDTDWTIFTRTSVYSLEAV